MQLLRSLLFAVLFYPGTILFILAAMLASLFGTGPMRAVVHGWARFHHALTRSILAIRLKAEGEIPAGPHLIAVKHQSMFETIEMLLFAETPVIVLKRELADLPLFGWITRRYGVIPVDRNAGFKALRTLVEAGGKAVAEHRPIIIFPEGTRVAPGDTPPLRSGFAALYRTLGLPVVPVAVDSGLLWGRGLVKRSGTIRLLVGETIPPGLPREVVEHRVHAAINAFELAP